MAEHLIPTVPSFNAFCQSRTKDPCHLPVVSRRMLKYSLTEAKSGHFMRLVSIHTETT